MTTSADSSVGFATESTYGTGVTPTRWFEYVSESLNWNKSVQQGAGLRVGSRVARSNRRVVTTADASGDVEVELFSKGLGLFLSACMGAGASTVVSGSTYQQVFTLADALPSLTVQKGLPRADGTVDPYTFTGAVVSQFELAFENDGIAKLKASLDAKDVSTATAYAAPSYPVGGNLFHFAGAAIYSGAFTAPTSTALASCATQLASVRSASVSVNNNITKDRFNFGGSGRKDKPTVGLREIAGDLEVEYSGTSFRDAFLNETPMSLVITLTAGPLSSGNETFQVAIPEIKIDKDLPQADGSSMIKTGIGFTVLDNLTAAQPIWVVTRTSDAAL